MSVAPVATLPLVGVGGGAGDDDEKFSGSEINARRWWERGPGCSMKNWWISPRPNPERNVIEQG